MIEPSGTPVDVLGIPNRQSRVPVLGAQPGGTRQTIAEGAPNDQAQDDPGMGAISTAGIAEQTPAHNMIIDCASPAQNAGSNANKFGPTISETATSYEAHHSKQQTDTGAMAAEGKTPAPHSTMPDNERGSGGDPLSNLSENSAKSVAGNTTPSGRIITAQNASTKDIGVKGSQLPGFPAGIIE